MQTAVSTSKIDAKAAETAPTLESKTTERGTTIDQSKDGTLTAGSSEKGKNTSAGQQTSVTPTTDTVAVEHSHPNNPNFGIRPGYERPGKGDHIAVERGYPNYITRDGKLIVIERSGGQYRVRVVNGNLSTSETQEIRRALNDFQRDSRNRNQ